MKARTINHGKNAGFLQQHLLKQMDATDAKQVVSKAEDLVKQLPGVQGSMRSRQGLLLGLIQSGKTVALTAAIALACDNGCRLFVVLTSDNLWLYEQTINRLKADLPGLQIEGKDDWEKYPLFLGRDLLAGDNGLVLVATKNATILNKLTNVLDQLRPLNNNTLPEGLIVDDEADQASLDTQASRRARNPSLDPGRMNELISQIRKLFALHTYLQVTATPQALFLQDFNNLYRPEFTILIEPGQGYMGGSTFFSLIEGEGKADDLIRYIDQSELDRMLRGTKASNNENAKSLWEALCIFFVGATIRYLQEQGEKPQSDLVYSFLCHISQKKSHHEKAFNAVVACYQLLRDGLSGLANSSLNISVTQSLQTAYEDLSKTLAVSTASSVAFADVVGELHQFVVGTEIQVLNSDKEQGQPHYNRRYNILIGGNKLARGVTIKNLLVTYYGRQSKTTNMDTMLQHARMYGYRQDHLGVTRLFVTKDIEQRFRRINESEHALRKVIQDYPDEDYRGIRIGKGLSATRKNVLNPNNMGAYAAGSSYFPRKPLFKRSDIEKQTIKLDAILDQLYSIETKHAVETTIDRIVELINLTASDPSGGGLWDHKRIITGLETLKSDPKYANAGYLVVRRDRGLMPNESGELRAYFGGATSKDAGDEDLANKTCPTLFMFRLRGARANKPGRPGWDGVPFWVPNVRFPDGQYALMFNFD